MYKVGKPHESILLQSPPKAREALPRVIVEKNATGGSHVALKSVRLGICALTEETIPS